MISWLEGAPAAPGITSGSCPRNNRCAPVRPVARSAGRAVGCFLAAHGAASWSAIGPVLSPRSETRLCLDDWRSLHFRNTTVSSETWTSRSRKRTTAISMGSSGKSPPGSYSSSRSRSTVSMRLFKIASTFWQRARRILVFRGSSRARILLLITFVVKPSLDPIVLIHRFPQLGSPLFGQGTLKLSSFPAARACSLPRSPVIGQGHLAGFKIVSVVSLMQVADHVLHVFG